MQTWCSRFTLRGSLHGLASRSAQGRLYRWLTGRGSLSERIRTGCDDHFHVRPLAQGCGRAWPDEAGLLGLAARQPALVREVLLCCGDTPVVFARSLAAAHHLDGPWRALRGLGSRPLATMLFADPGIERGALAYRRLDGRSRLYRQAAAAVPGLPPQLWARRSVFVRAGAPLLVTEVFLPGVLWS